jgi:alpha-beta hydrolase superfamily lysophospholipase
LAGLDVSKLRAEYEGPHELVRTSDGKTLFVRLWDAARESPVSVLIFHGITGYSGPYGPMVADQLTGAGYNVFGLDLRGHGLSDGKRGDYPSADRFAKDLAEILALVKSKSHKLVLMGHSLGVLVAIAAVKNNPRAVDDLVLVSAAKRIRTGVYPKPRTWAMLKTLIGVAILRGNPLIEYRRAGQLGLDDPLFNFNYSARYYTVLYGVGALKVMRMLGSGMIDSPNLTFNDKLRIPLFVAVGEKDELFPVDGARDFFDGIDCDDKEFHVIPSASHAVWPKDSFSPLVEWLQKKF